MNNLKMRTATVNDAEIIWEILQQAIERRRLDGSDQWQDGYPNPERVALDIEKRQGYVLTLNKKVVAYCALIFNDEPAYSAIKGQWLTNESFLVIHRVAVSASAVGKGMATKLFEMAETFAMSNGVYSIKVDTNFDNAAMLHILNKLGYTYCGEVVFRGSARKAFEKVLKEN